MPNFDFKSLLAKAKHFPAAKTAVVHPVTHEAIEGLVEAANNNIIIPILIGPIDKIKLAARKISVDLSSYEIIHAEHSHAAAEHAVMLARTGSVDMFNEGQLAY